MTPSPDKTTIVVRQPTRDELGDVREFRRHELDIAIDPTQTGPTEPTASDLDPATIHMAAYNSDKLVSAVRLEPVSGAEATYLVNRMVTAADYRGRGIGAQVLVAAEAVAIDHGAKMFVLDARPQAEQFYARLGYDRQSGRTAAKTEEIPMEKVVK